MSKTVKIERLLGIDTALRTTGFGVIDTDGRRFQVVDCGTIRTTRQQPLSECLRRLAGGIEELVDKYAPDTTVIEGGFYCRNVKTAMVLGSARGVVIATVAKRAIPIFEYAPRRVKQAVCGYGNASKQQVALLVGQVLNLNVQNIEDDATDALGLALCHAQLSGVMQGLMLPDPL